MCVCAYIAWSQVGVRLKSVAMVIQSTFKFLPFLRDSQVRHPFLELHIN